jgi:hypothetical protein
MSEMNNKTVTSHNNTLSGLTFDSPVLVDVIASVQDFFVELLDSVSDHIANATINQGGLQEAESHEVEEVSAQQEVAITDSTSEEDVGTSQTQQLEVALNTEPEIIESETQQQLPINREIARFAGNNSGSKLNQSVAESADLYPAVVDEHVVILGEPIVLEAPNDLTSVADDQNLDTIDLVPTYSINVSSIENLDTASSDTGGALVIRASSLFADNAPFTNAVVDASGDGAISSYVEFISESDIVLEGKFADHTQLQLGDEVLRGVFLMVGDTTVFFEDATHEQVAVITNVSIEGYEAIYQPEDEVASVSIPEQVEQEEVLQNQDVNDRFVAIEELADNGFAILGEQQDAIADDSTPLFAGDQQEEVADINPVSLDALNNAVTEFSATTTSATTAAIADVGQPQDSGLLLAETAVATAIASPEQAVL